MASAKKLWRAHLVSGAATEGSLHPQHPLVGEHGGRDRAKNNDETVSGLSMNIDVVSLVYKAMTWETARHSPQQAGHRVGLSAT